MIVSWAGLGRQKSVRRKLCFFRRLRIDLERLSGRFGSSRSGLIGTTRAELDAKPFERTFVFCMAQSE
jgi:hypothetical protein